MADKYYAWSPILTGADASGRPTGVKFGEEVSKAKLGVDDENFDALVEASSVRTNKPPDLPKDYQGSVLDFLRQQAREAAGSIEEAAEAEAALVMEAEKEA